nr:uncharacterized protein LOC105843972 [Hydra vulgaris]
MNELSALCGINMPDLIFISDTWFTETSATQLNNYSLVKKKRIGHGEGVAIYIKRDLVAHEVSDCHLRETLNNSNSEQIWCEIKIINEMILIGCVYRPPLSHIDDRNKTIISAKQAVDRKAYSCMLLAGDFNFPDIKWHNDERIELLSGQNSAASVFLVTLANHNLEQLVDFSTFEASNGNAKNVLDLIITDSSTRVINLSSSMPLGDLSQGHRILSWDYVVLSKNRTTFSNKKYDFNKGDYKNFGKKIMETNWQQLFENKNTNECYELFCNKYDKLSKQFIPLKKVHSTRNAPWMNKEVLVMIKKKQQLGNYLSMTNWGSTTLICEYKKLRSQVQKACTHRVRVFEAQLASDKNNPKRMYAYAKAQQNVHVSIGAISDAKGKTLTEAIHIANRLNEHFKSVFVDDSINDQLPVFERRHNQEDLGDVIKSFEATLAYLNGLNPNKSIGVDNIIWFKI